MMRAPAGDEPLDTPIFRALAAMLLPMRSKSAAKSVKFNAGNVGGRDCLLKLHAGFHVEALNRLA